MGTIQKIVIDFDESGRIEKAETFGIKGADCLAELEAILEGIAEVDQVEHTSEFNEKPHTEKHTRAVRKTKGAGIQRQQIRRDED